MPTTGEWMHDVLNISKHVSGWPDEWKEMLVRCIEDERLPDRTKYEVCCDFFDASLEYDENFSCLASVFYDAYLEWLEAPKYERFRCIQKEFGKHLCRYLIEKNVAFSRRKANGVIVYDGLRLRYGAPTC